MTNSNKRYCCCRITVAEGSAGVKARLAGHIGDPQARALATKRGAGATAAPNAATAAHRHHCCEMD